MKRVLLWALVFGIAVVVLIYGTGALLPQDHVASVRATYSVDPETMYDAIAQYHDHPNWRRGVDRVEALEPRGGRPAWREIGRTGTIEMELTEADPPHRMVTTIIGDDLPFGGRWIVEIEERPEGSALQITEEGEIYNPLFRFVSRFIIGYHTTAATYLADLGELFGDEIEVEVVQ